MNTQTDGFPVLTAYQEKLVGIQKRYDSLVEETTEKLLDIARDEYEVRQEAPRADSFERSFAVIAGINEACNAIKDRTKDRFYEEHPGFGR